MNIESNEWLPPLAFAAIITICFVGWLAYLWNSQRTLAEMIIESSSAGWSLRTGDADIHEALRKQGVRWPLIMTRRLLKQLATEQKLLHVVNSDGTDFYRPASR